MVSEMKKQSEVSSTAHSFSVHHQAVFSDSGTAHDDGDERTSIGENGFLELDDTPSETTLFDHGVDIDTRTPTPRIETGGSDEFVDDRPVSAVRERLGGDSQDSEYPSQQGMLFASTDADQRTLDGEQASARFMFDHRRQRGRIDEQEY
ncbi:hypothetical protein ACFQMA_09235 [Halosimplex aquaticum]|uniref:Uncharacterized protein n=1 Tax=Halosimplex aquaticum TaxID=3026162 RepID=A0ABD5Y1B5_9EURY|nr:hypothetical protein [Halosimplex aquaticum]